MQKAQKKGKKHSIGWKSVLVFALVCYLGYRIISQQIMYQDLKKQEAELNQRIAVATEEKETLESQKGLYNTKEFVESVARERLGFVYPDETIFIDTSGK